MGKIHLVMPMGGAGCRFQKDGYEIPKPMIKIKGKPFFYWAAMSVKKYINLEDIRFIVLQQHLDDFHLDKEIYEYFPEAQIYVLPEVLPGPVFTCLEGTKDICDDLPVLFNDCDHLFRCSAASELFNSGNLSSDGVLLTFLSSEPQFSYVRYGQNGEIVGTVEKQVVSDHAICGAYVFKNTALFRMLAREYIDNCPYAECFMSGIYNIMCQKNLVVKDLFLDHHVGFGTPEEYKKALGSQYFEELG